MNETDLCFVAAHELARLVRDGEVSVPEVVTAHLRRIERCNPELGAYVHVTGEQALATAEVLQGELKAGARVGPLHGVPIAIKDLEDVAGVPTTSGSRGLVDTVPTEDAVFTARLREAGAVILGKTNTPELGHKGTTDNLVFGPTSSPFVRGTNAGGSSGGSAAAVADGLAVLAQGGDGGGSIRIPASLCGVYGLKPSWGRVPHVYRPDGFLVTPLVQHGPLTRTVRDAATMLGVMAGPHPRDPLSLPDDGCDFVGACDHGIEGLRVAYSRTMGGFPVEPAVAAVVDDAVSALRAAGASVDEVEPAFDRTHQELCAVWRRGIAVVHAELVATQRARGVDLVAAGQLEPELLRSLEIADGIGAVDHKLDDVVRTQVFDAIQDVFDEYDLLVSPTLAIASIENADDGLTVGPAEVNGEPVDPLIGWCLTYVINFTGHPAASVPAGLTPEGSPVGLQIVGRRFADDVVLAASAAVEQARPWAHAYPGRRDVTTTA